jgi:hypothetical protein
MDFSDPVTKQYLVALAAFVVGLAGWLLPDKYNILKLKARYAKYVSARTNILIARTLGTVFILFGLLIAIGTTMVGEIK